MTVKELIEKLSSCPPDYNVEFGGWDIVAIKAYDEWKIVELGE